MTRLRDLSTEQLLAQRRVLLRQLAVTDATTKLLPFIRLTMPHPDDPDDPEASQYQVTPQALLLIEIMEKVFERKQKRVAVSIGPQLGKSEIISRRAPAWMVGRDPRINLMLGSYNQDFANEFGDEVRAITRLPVYKEIFPDFALRTGSQAKDYMVTTQGGRLAFVGVGGSGTGKPADIFLVDDPYRNQDDAESAAYRERVWQWFNKVAFSRIHKDSAIVVVHTRWHEDDLIGRLCDPDHPERNSRYKGIADKWTYINIPAVVTDTGLAKALKLTLDVPTQPEVVAQFGRKPMSALWPERKPLELLAEARQQDARGFDALYMGRPTPDDGYYFTTDMIVEYDRHELPAELRIYAASDHAVTEKQQNDATVLGCVGIDPRDNIYVLPTLVWDQMPTDRLVEEMLALMRQHKPLIWWMESELISKSFGPFLKKRMQETSTYCMIEPVTPTKDKRSRARSIQGRMAMRKVYFPRFAPWWPAARSQLLKFPFGAHDDFVDWLAHIGHGLVKEVAADPARREPENVVRVGSLAWVKAAAEQERRRARMSKQVAGF